MSTADIQRRLVEDLNNIHDPHERLSVVVSRHAGARLAEEHKVKANIVTGCVSRVWLVARNEGGQFRLQSDADSPMVKGLVALLCELYDGAAPADVLSMEPDIWELCGFTRLLSPTRMAGLASVRARIRKLAEEQLHAAAGGAAP